MNQQTTANSHQVDSGFKAELMEILSKLNEMSDARNFESVSSPTAALDKVANRTTDMDTMFKELRRTLPATYFRNNSRIKRVFDQILEAHNCNREELHELRQQGGHNGGVVSTSRLLENLERTKRRITDLIGRL